MEAVAVEQWREEVIWVATLVLSGVTRLRSIIAGTRTARRMLAHASELLREATGDAANLADYAFDHVPAIAAPPLHVEVAAKLLAASMFDGPLPGSIDAARRIVGHLSGTLPLPPAEYPQIDQCGGDLADLTRDFYDIWRHLFICGGTLGFTQGSQEWQSWRVLAVYSAAQSTEATARLATADMHATEVFWNLRNLCECWEDPLEADDPSRAEGLSSAEVNLQDAMNLMDGALAAMHQMDGAITSLYYQARVMAEHQA